MYEKQIFCLVHPLDLIHLSRTCKAFRSFLMNRHSGRLVWSYAIAQLGFPECPSYMTESSYAHLAFEPVCHASLPCHLLEYLLNLSFIRSAEDIMTVSLLGHFVADFARNVSLNSTFVGSNSCTAAGLYLPFRCILSLPRDICRDEFLKESLTIPEIHRQDLFPTTYCMSAAFVFHLYWQ